MRFKLFVYSAVLFCSLAVIPAAAQGLGFYPVEELGILDPGNLEVDINLEGSTLKIAAGAMQDEDPRIMELVNGLTRVRVQVGSTEDLDPSIVADRFDGALAQLESQGWVRIIRVEDGTERVYVYSIDGSNEMIAGLTALVNSDGEEVVVANIVGNIDPVLLGSAISRMHNVDFSQFIPADSDED